MLLLVFATIISNILPVPYNIGKPLPSALREESLRKRKGRKYYGLVIKR
jgi:hypothetical protein